jgi:hypothetical protein
MISSLMLEYVKHTPLIKHNLHFWFDLNCRTDLLSDLPTTWLSGTALRVP